MIKLILLFLLSSSAFGALSEADRSIITVRNLLTNPGFESDKAAWVASGGSFTIDTSTIGFGKASGNFDASAAAQTLSSTQAIPAGLFSQSGVATCYFKTAATDYIFDVFDGTSVIASHVIPASTTFAGSLPINFQFPSSGNIVLRVRSQSNAAAINIDDCYIGFVRPMIYSAIVSSTGAVCSVLSQNVSFLTTPGTRNATGDCSFSFVSAWATTPTCTMVSSSDNSAANTTFTISLFTLSTTTIRYLRRYLQNSPTNAQVFAQDGPAYMQCVGTP